MYLECPSFFMYLGDAERGVGCNLVSESDARSWGFVYLSESELGNMGSGMHVSASCTLELTPLCHSILQIGDRQARI